MPAPSVLLLKQCFLTVLWCNCQFFRWPPYGGIIERERGAVRARAYQLSVHKSVQTHTLWLCHKFLSAATNIKQNYHQCAATSDPVPVIEQ